MQQSATFWPDWPDWPQFYTREIVAANMQLTDTLYKIHIEHNRV
jgi:hypothetical protein